MVSDSWCSSDAASSVIVVVIIKNLAASETTVSRLQASISSCSDSESAVEEELEEEEKARLSLTFVSSPAKKADADELRGGYTTEECIEGVGKTGAVLEELRGGGGGVTDECGVESSAGVEDEGIKRGPLPVPLAGPNTTCDLWC